MLAMSIALLRLVRIYGDYTASAIPVINELCSRNFSVATAADGGYYDYIELYNGSDEDYTMTGLYLSDDVDEPYKYDMSEITVPAGGYVVIWMTEETTSVEDALTGLSDMSDLDELTGDDLADGMLSCGQYVCPFALSSRGEYIYISNESGRILDSVTIPALSYNVAYGRRVDGESGYIGMEATPGASNNDAEEIALDHADVPILSAESGFYDSAFELTIAHTLETDVYYTLDGTAPTTESLRYDGPITIEDASDNPNVYSAHDDIYLHNYVPEEPVDKAVVVRAIAVDRLTGSVSNVVSRTYFVGFDEKSVYDHVAVISLITDPDNLYDYDTGIYVMGATYEEYKEKGGFLSAASSQVPSAFSNSSGNKYWRYTYTNAEHRGRKWEREVTVEYYDADHTLQLTQDAGMRIAGESTRHYPHKSLNLIARGIYGNGEWGYPFWGYGGKQTIRLRASAGEEVNWKESFLHSLTDGRSLSVQHSVPCAVFMDGEYWGLYQITEQYDEAYFENYYGIPADTLTIYKNHKIIHGDEEQGMSDYDDLEEIVTTYDLSQDHLYQLVVDRADMDSMADYYAMQTYLSNVDITDHHNQEMWRSNAEGMDNRWRYVAYDLDMTCADPAYNTIAYYKEERGTFYWPMYLCANDAFRQQYVTTMMDLANVEYSYNRVHQRLADKAAELGEQQIASKRRYESAAYDEAAYETAVTQIDTFFRERRSYMEQYLAEDLGLSDVATVTVTNSDPGAGAVKVNSSVLTQEDYTIDGTSGTWTGEYFTDYAVTLYAAPLEGYAFVGWSGDVESTEATITVPLTTEGLRVQANFAKAE